MSVLLHLCTTGICHPLHVQTALGVLRSGYSCSLVYRTAQPVTACLLLGQVLCFQLCPSTYSRSVWCNLSVTHFPISTVLPSEICQALFVAQVYIYSCTVYPWYSCTLFALLSTTLCPGLPECPGTQWITISMPWAWRAAFPGLYSYGFRHECCVSWFWSLDAICCHSPWHSILRLRGSAGTLACSSLHSIHTVAIVHLLE